jgi:hypothetical protein
MSQPEESRTKTASTDDVLMRPEVAPPPKTGETRVEIDDELVPLESDGTPRRAEGPR